MIKNTFPDKSESTENLKTKLNSSKAFGIIQTLRNAWGEGRVANFVTNRYGNKEERRRVSVMLLCSADNFFYMDNFTKNLPIGNYSLYYLTSKTLAFRWNLLYRQTNSLKAGEKKFFGSILVRSIEFLRVGLEENWSECQVCLTKNTLHCNHNIQIYQNVQTFEHTQSMTNIVYALYLQS